MKTIGMLIVIFLSSCQLTLSKPTSGVSEADLAQRDAQLKQLVTNIATALDKKVDKPEVKASK